MSMLNYATLIGTGVLGASQAAGVDVAIITNPGPGKYLVWGVVRHTLVDGCRLKVGTTSIIDPISAGAASAVSFGPLTLEVTNNTDDIILELATGTGGSDSASATIYAHRLN